MKKIVVGLLIITFILFLWGYIDKGDKEVVSIQTNSNNEIFYSLVDIPKDLSKVSNLNVRQQDIIASLSRGLIKKDSKGKILCDLAQSYEVKDNGLEYVFTIRQDAYWSDGSRINTKDVWEFFKELIDTQEEKDIKTLMNVYGVSDYKKGIGTFNDNVAIHIEKNSIKFRLNIPDNDFINKLTQLQYRLRKYIVLWKDIAKNYNHIKYSGYYYISNITEKSIEVSCVKNNDKKICFINDNSKEEAMAKYYMGERDIIFSPPLSEARRIDKKNIVNYKLTTGLYLGIDENKIPINSRRLIYKDINEAIDEYEEFSMSEVINAKGCYLRDEINNLNLVQERKVFINNIEEASLEGNIIINAKQDEKSKEMCEYLSTWFKKNKNYNIKYYLLNDDDFEEKLNNKYTIVLLNSEDEKFYSYIQKIYNKDDVTINEEELSKLSNIFLLKCQIIPVCFFNENLCLSGKINELQLDYYFNIDFAALS